MQNPFYRATVRLYFFHDEKNTKKYTIVGIRWLLLPFSASLYLSFVTREDRQKLLFLLAVVAHLGVLRHDNANNDAEETNG